MKFKKGDIVVSKILLCSINYKKNLVITSIDRKSEYLVTDVRMSGKCEMVSVKNDNGEIVERMSTDFEFCKSQSRDNRLNWILNN